MVIVYIKGVGIEKVSSLLSRFSLQVGKFFMVETAVHWMWLDFDSRCSLSFKGNLHSVNKWTVNCWE